MVRRVVALLLVAGLFGCSQSDGAVVVADAQGSADSAASTGLPTCAIVSIEPTETPFIKRLVFEPGVIGEAHTVQVAVASKQGAHAAPLYYRYTRNYLESVGDLIGDQLTLSVFGLYQATDNQVTLVLHGLAGGAAACGVEVPVEAFVDPAGIFDSHAVEQHFDVHHAPSFDYFYFKSAVGRSQVIMDVDGEVRWYLPTGDGLTTTFLGNRFLGSRFRIGLDGRVTYYEVTTPGTELEFSTFHHSLRPGKTGIFGYPEMAMGQGVMKETSFLLEMTEGGVVSKLWDLGQIITDHMVANGEDPALFVMDTDDWFHINDALYDPRDDSIILSSREQFVMKIDYETGGIRWLLGDSTKYWYTFPSLRQLALDVVTGEPPIGQHSLSFASDGTLLLFNNGKDTDWAAPQDLPGVNLESSLIQKFQLDEAAKTATQTWVYDAGIYSGYCSSVHQDTVTGSGDYLLVYSVAAMPPWFYHTVISSIIDESQNVLMTMEFVRSEACGTMFSGEPLDLSNIVF